MTITPKWLSASTSGQSILIVNTSAQGGQSIHTATSVANSVDNIHITVFNPNSTTQNVHFCWGVTASPQNLIAAVPASGYANIPFIMLSNQSISAFCDSASGVVVTGRCYTEAP